MKEHHYTLQLKWAGNLGKGTSGYNDYSRDHNIRVKGKRKISCSSDPSFKGDDTRYNPEELFLASISNCHLLWYLHLCAVNNVIVISYEDNPVGKMVEKKDGSGHFESVVLRPTVEVEHESMMEKALSLHHDANEKCFIANSLNFKVEHEPEVVVYLQDK